MAAYLWIAVGSALGGMARYWCSGVAARLIGETFPWGTIIVNIVGSFIIGFFATLTGPDGRIFADTLTRQFVMIGILRRLHHLLLLQPADARPWCRTANGCWPAPTSPSRWSLVSVAVWLGYAARQPRSTP